MLVIGLGYRRSRAILPFAHDLSLAEALAFIADKMREGSEARFVPLVDALLRQIKAYLAHVQFLVAELSKTYPALASSIQVAVGLVRGAEGQAPVRHTGPFFRIRGGRAVPVTTVAVDWAIREALTALGLAQDPRIDTRALRRSLATWLGDDGISGAHIEMILGHVREKHPFGPSSVWIPLQEFESMREPMSRYFAEMGCKYIGAPWARALSGRFAAPTPSFEPSAQAYEGRRIEADEARMRARQCVLSVVPEDVLFHGRSKVLDSRGDASAAVRRALQRDRAVARPREHEYHPSLRRSRPRDEGEGPRKARGARHQAAPLPRVGLADALPADTVTRDYV